MPFAKFVFDTIFHLLGIVAAARKTEAELLEHIVQAHATVERLRTEIATHECEDVAGGALDAQADAERAMFAERQRADAAEVELAELRAAIDTRAAESDLDAVLSAAEGWATEYGPWRGGNPDHMAGGEPRDDLYNALVRWARSGRPGVTEATREHIVKLWAGETS